jgi:branched-chain amino acid transport system permease protein
MLLGQGGMLSFGHAVYSGLGAFLAIHALNAVSSGSLPIPVSAVPLVGGVGGHGVCCVAGLCHHAKGGHYICHDYMGLAELVFAMSLMIPEFFGGEGWRPGQPNGGQSIHGYYFWTTHSGLLPDCGLHIRSVPLLMFAFTRTRLGSHAQCGARQP